MKILIVIDSLGSGGAQKLKGNLAKSLSDLGHVVELFIYNPKGDFFTSEFQSYGIKIHAVEKKKEGFSLYIVKQLRSIILEHNYDGVISSMHAPSIYAALAMIGRSVKGRLIVCEESSSNAPVPILKKLLFYLASLSAYSVVANSFNEARLLKRRPGLSKKTHAILNGFEIPAPSKDQTVTQNKNLKLLVVGRIAYPKNGVNLLKALSLFYDRNGWIPRVEWAGRRDGSFDKSIEMQKEMDKYLLKNTKLSSKLAWLGEVKDIVSLYRKSDALLLVSIYEGLPMVICEAMIEGCFVIASNVCDHPFIIGDEERGFLCDPLSPESICNSIERLSVMSFSEKSNMIKNAREFAELNFDQGSMSSAYESLLIEHNSC
jgi:glycosyltransferase involved in cell wall biosynthesis